MSIKMQKRIMFIPIVNSLICVFSWIGLTKKTFVDSTFFLKKWVIIVLCFLAIVIPFTIINEFIDNRIVNRIIESIMFYSITLMISFRAIKAQEELLNI